MHGEDWLPDVGTAGHTFDSNSFLRPKLCKATLGVQGPAVFPKGGQAWPKGLSGTITTYPDVSGIGLPMGRVRLIRS